MDPFKYVNIFSFLGSALSSGVNLKFVRYFRRPIYESNCLVHRSDVREISQTFDSKVVFFHNLESCIEKYRFLLQSAKCNKTTAPSKKIDTSVEVPIALVDTVLDKAFATF